MALVPKRRLHVAIVAPHFPLERHERGYPHVMETIERLTAGCDVDVIALRDGTPHAAYRMAGARVRRLGLRSAHGPIGRARVLAAGVREVLRVHKRAEVDLVHGLWVDEPGAVATIAARLIRRPSIASVLGGELVSFHDLGYGAAIGRGGRWTTAVTFRLAGAVTVGSVLLRDLVDLHRPGSLLHPLGIDVTRFRPPAEGNRLDSFRRVLFVGALEPVKDPALAIRTFALLAAQRPDLRLELWGEGSLRSSLERLSDGLGVHEQVSFRGHVPHPEMPRAYEGASLVLVTSRFESQSVVALEAAAAGVPVVATRVGILPELGEAATVVEKDSDDVLAAAAARVLDDPALATRMAAAGQALATERFDLARTVGGLLDLYLSLTRARQREPLA